MAAEVLQLDQIDRAVVALQAGQLVAFPTETVYGLGADAASADAVKQIFVAKGRPSQHPLIVHVADSHGLDRLGANIPDAARILAEAFWPGPLTIVVDRRSSSSSDTGLVAAETVGGKLTVGLRVPDHPVALELLRRFNGGVAAPSANLFGGVSPTTAQHVVDDLGSSVAFVIDGGPSAIGVESTIVDVSTSHPTLLRPGGISTVELEAVLGTSVRDGLDGPSRAPGMMVSHYSPHATVELVTVDELSQVLLTERGSVTDSNNGVIGLIAPRVDDALSSLASDSEMVDGDVFPEVVTWNMSTEARGYAAKLYAVLREADKRGVDKLFVVPPERGELLDAVVDRLQKAAADKP